MRVVLVACAAQKLDHAAPARELYTSALFTKSLRYALQLAPSTTWIMSALNGLTNLDAVIAPYDRTLNDVSKQQRVWWGINLVDSLRQRLQSAPREKPPTVVLLGGELYNGPVRGALIRIGWGYEDPMRGMQIGERLQWLNRQLVATLTKTTKET